MNDAIYQSNNFVVTVGIPPGEDINFEVYLVTNRATGVVEFAHNVLHIAREWVDDMERAIEAWEITKAGETPIESVVDKSYN